MLVVSADHDAALQASCAANLRGLAEHCPRWSLGGPFAGQPMPACAPRAGLMEPEMNETTQPQRNVASEPVASEPVATHTALAIGACNGQLCAIAARPYRVGEEIVRLTGVLVTRPSRYSVQIAENQHIEPPSGAALEEMIGEHTWRYMNHACEPNAAFRGRTLVALRPIAAGDEVRFHYAATEYEMAEPFACRCGARTCAGEVRGYRYLSAEQRALLAEHAQPHVRAAAAREVAGRTR